MNGEATPRPWFVWKDGRVRADPEWPNDEDYEQPYSRAITDDCCTGPADATLIVEAVNAYDRLRAIEAAAREWYEADRAYVEAPFGEDEEEQAVARVAKDALRSALDPSPPAEERKP